MKNEWIQIETSSNSLYSPPPRTKALEAFIFTLFLSQSLLLKDSFSHKFLMTLVVILTASSHDKKENLWTFYWFKAIDSLVIFEWMHTLCIWSNDSVTKSDPCPNVFHQRFLLWLCTSLAHAKGSHYIFFGETTTTIEWWNETRKSLPQPTGYWTEASEQTTSQSLLSGAHSLKNEKNCFTRSWRHTLRLCS